MREKMMADQKAATARLQPLIDTMNAAKGEAKVDAIAAVLTELVHQRSAQMDHMSGMMMPDGMMMQMQAMSGDMRKLAAECPMMKGVDDTGPKLVRVSRLLKIGKRPHLFQEAVRAFFRPHATTKAFRRSRGSPGAAPVLKSREPRGRPVASSSASFAMPAPPHATSYRKGPGRTARSPHGGLLRPPTHGSRW